MKKALYLACFLAIIAAVSGAALTLTNNFTAPKIKENEIASEKSNLELIFPGADFEKVESFKDDTKTIDSIYKAGDQGYVYKMIVDGFGGKKSITFMVGFSSDGKIAGYTVLSSGETKGIGSQVGEETFVKSVIGKSNGDEVDAISGATISSTAIKTALNTASSHYASNYQGK